MAQNPQLSKQHPVPQNVMAVEFKLIGDMTVRQFFFLAVGLGIAFIINKSILPIFFKWPLMIAFGFGGVASAFIPIQDRSFDIWIRNFLKSVYSPTQRIWKKEPEPPSYFLNEYAEMLKHEVVALAPTKSRKKLTTYLEGIHEEEKGEIDQKIEGFVKNLKFDVEPSKKLKLEEREKQRAASRERRAETREKKLKKKQRAPLEPAVVQERPVSNGVNNELMVVPEIKPKESSAKAQVEGKPGRKLKNLPLMGGEIILPAKEKKIVELTGGPMETRERRSAEIVETQKGRPERSTQVMAKFEDLKKTIEEIRLKQVEVSGKKSPKEPSFKAPRSLVGIIPRRELKASYDQNQVVKRETEELKEEISHLTKKAEQLKEIAKRVPGTSIKDLNILEFYKEQIKVLEEENKTLEDKLSKKKNVEKLIADLKEQNVKYQKELGSIKSENENLSQAIRKGQAELKGLRGDKATSESDIKLKGKRIKLAEERLEALAKEKQEAEKRIGDLKKQVIELQKTEQRVEKVRQAPLEPAVVRERPASNGVKRTGRRKPKIRALTDLPNVINGYVRNKQGKLTEGAVIIVKDNDGDPVRALKTNNLGQFVISTPLPNGTYSVQASYQGKLFDTIDVEVDSSVLSPIELKNE